MLRGEGLIKRYKRRTVVDGANVEVRQGEIVGLLGPNGAGKTTTFYMITGLVKPNEGHVFLDDEDITGLAMYKRAQKGIGYLPQEPSVFRKLSVEDNIRAILELTSRSKADQRTKLESLLNEFGLQHVRKSMGDVLSGGERRRTEIARALATEPRFILLDEPFAGVDPIAVEDIQGIVAHLKDRGIGVLITDHNVQETLSITDRAYLLYEGRILKQGNAEELAGDPEVREKYLGRNFELRAKEKGDLSAQFLGSLNPVELAFLMEYKYPRLTAEAQERVDAFLRSVFVSRSVLAGVFEQATSAPRGSGSGQCPRCGSSKLDIVSEPKMDTNHHRWEGSDPHTGGKVAMVDRITCRVCDLRIADPNG